MLPYLWGMTGLALAYWADAGMRKRNELGMPLRDWLVSAGLWPVAGAMMALGPRSTPAARFTGLLIVAVAVTELRLATLFG